MTLEISCVDFLQDNRKVYAVKAARKKIAILRVEAANRDATNVHINWGSSQLTAGGKTFHVERPAVVLRKLSEFTWDFLLFAIIDFNSLAALLELVVFLIGPIYNRRLKRQLRQLTDREIVLRPGETAVALLAFRGPARPAQRLTIFWQQPHGAPQPWRHSFEKA